MPFPVIPNNISDVYAQLRSTTQNAMSWCQQVQTALGTGGVAASTLLSTLNAVIVMAAEAEVIAENEAMLPVMVAYVQTIIGNSTLDVQTEFTASLVAAKALVAAIISDYPKDAAGFLLDRTLDTSGNQQWISLDTAKLPTAAPALTAWLATVE